MAGGARICLGQIGAAHGVRGEVRLRSFTSNAAAITSYGPLESEDGRVFAIESLRPAKDHFVARLAGICDRNAAEQLTNIKLYVPRDRLPEPEQADQFYHADLVGLAVVDRAGQKLGTVVAIYNFGAGDLIEVRQAEGEPTQMLPFDEATVPEVDLAAGQLVVAAPEGTFAPSPAKGEGKMWRASVLTIFPEMFPGPLGLSLAGKAMAAGAWSLDVVDIRNFATDKHRTVDDTPAGGGPGMVLKADVLGRAIDAAASDARPRLLMSPRGVPLTQARIEALTLDAGVILVCGRFEGVDERVIAARGLEEISIGDYVLSGGEIAAMALIDACVRLLPGVMGAPASGAEESFADGLLEYPQYTRPQLWEGRPIPEILTSGDHGKIAAWRRAEAERLTSERRPDLWAAFLRRLRSGSRAG
jgi:tRNA (guanine37-N1)-methyltransferase